MTGSGRNISASSILCGMVLAEDESGNVFPADEASPGFALALEGAPKGGVVSYQTDGVASRKDWQALAGAARLTPGKAYFAAPGGRLALSGRQQVGIARSGTDLRISLGPVTPLASQLHPVSGPPPAALGKPLDVAYDATAGRIYSKTVHGWGAPRLLLIPRGNAGQAAFSAAPTNTGGWVLLS